MGRRGLSQGAKQPPPPSAATGCGRAHSLPPPACPAAICWQLLLIQIKLIYSVKFNFTMTFRMIWINLEQASTGRHVFLGINIYRKKTQTCLLKRLFRTDSDYTEYHRMVGVGRDLCGSSSPTPCRSWVTYSRL